MKTTEIISTWDRCETTYQIDKITEDLRVSIILRDVKKHPYGVIAVVEFPRIEGITDLPMMNWDNLFRCSNYYGIPPEETDIMGNLGYMAAAVQKGLKPAATFRYPIEAPIVQRFKRSLPDDCMILPYKEENATFICHRFSLSHIYSLQNIKNRYERYGISNIDWPFVGQCLEKEMAFFADNSVSGLSIERGAKNNTEQVIIGLLLGYPIESTVASIRNTDHVIICNCKNQAKKHFESHTDPFVDVHQNTWIKIGEQIIVDRQQESLYY